MTGDTGERTVSEQESERIFDLLSRIWAASNPRLSDAKKPDLAPLLELLRSRKPVDPVIAYALADMIDPKQAMANEYRLKLIASRAHARTAKKKRERVMNGMSVYRYMKSGLSHFAAIHKRAADLQEAGVKIDEKTLGRHYSYFMKWLNLP